MTCKYNIKVAEGNDFTLLFPLKKRTYVASLPVDEDIVIMDLENVKVTIGDVEFTSTLDERGVMVFVGAGSLERGTYDMIITAEYHGAQIRAAYFDGLTIVAWSMQADAEQYLPGSPIVMQAAFVIGGPLTDAELEALKEQYRERNAELAQATADMEAAKEHYDELAEQLQGVAQEQTLTDGVQAIREDISHIDIDTSDLAKESSVKDGNDTAIGMLKDQTNGLEAIKTAVGAIPTTAPATPTNVSDAQTAIIAAMPSTSGLATESNATANKNAIIAQIQANAGVPTLTIPSTTAIQELAPNTLYVFAERTTDLALTLGTPIVGVANEYHLFLVVGSTAPTITWPTGISWNGGSAPTIAASKTYEVSILNNVAAYFEV